MLKIQGLRKEFDGKVVLDGIDLTVEDGDVYGILGLSGAGKSTLVRCINGLERPDQGSIYDDGKLLLDAKTPIKREKLREIAMIFQSFGLLYQKSVLDNVLLPLRFSGTKEIPDKVAIQKAKDRYRESKVALGRKEARREYRHALKKAKYPRAFEELANVGIEDKWDAYPSQLSGGQAQRVAIARALMTNPRILLCDEATSALDVETADSIIALLSKLNKERGLTIIIISHQLSVIEKACNKVAIISDSKIVESGLLADIFLSPRCDITKRLVYSGRSNTLLDEDNSIRLAFDGNVDEPIVSNIIQDLGIVVSIIYADTKVIDGKIYGQLVFKLPSKKEDSGKLSSYLKKKGIRFEEVTNDGIL